MQCFIFTDLVAKEITEAEFCSIIGDEVIRPYASKVYRGELPIDEVPKDIRESVSAVVTKRIEYLGEYDQRRVPDKELKALIEVASDMTRGEAKSFANSLSALRDNATDAQASCAVSVYPTLKENSALVSAGTRINWNGTLKRAAVDLWDTAENNPDNAPTLWEDVNYRDGYRIIPETITAGLAFAVGECGWWNDVLYRSKLEANVYTPEQYPAGWETVTE